MVVEKPVTLALYNHFPFSGPYWTLNVSIPEYGPQLTNILSASTLLDSMMIGVIIWLLIVGQYGEAGAEVVSFTKTEDEEDDVEAHEDLLTVVFLKVIAAVWAIALPLSVAPPAGKSIDA